MRIHCSRPHLEVEVGALTNTTSVGTLILNLASSMVRSKFLLCLNSQALDLHSHSVNKLAQSADGLCGSVELTEALVAVSCTVLSWFSQHQLSGKSEFCGDFCLGIHLTTHNCELLSLVFAARMKHHPGAGDAKLFYCGSQVCV